MRSWVMVLVLARCARSAAERVPVAVCGACEEQTEPHLGMSNSTQVGACRYEVRPGRACCLVRWNNEPPRHREPPHRTVALEQPDGGFRVKLFSTITEPNFTVNTAALCPGERFIVCGQPIECAP